MNIEFLRKKRTLGLFFFSFGILFYLLLVMTPGYFNHDEIIFGIRSQQASLGDISWPWFSYLEGFHYRPLSFTLWLFLSYFLFEIPQFMHIVFVLAAIGNGVLLYLLCGRIFQEKHVGVSAYLFFIIFPASTFVHGWVGTIAELLYVFFFLLIALTLANNYLRYSEKKEGRCQLFGLYEFRDQSFIALLFLLALFSKETAVVLPGVLLGCIIFVKPWRGLKLAIVSTSLMVVIYMLVRREGLFSADEAGPYVVAFDYMGIWGNMWRYLLYPFALSDINISVITKAKIGTMFIPIVSFLCFCVIMLRHSWKVFFGYFYFYLVFISPVLLLPLISSRPHYLYGSGVVVAFVLALLLRAGQFFEKIAILLIVFVFVFHSVLIQKNFLDVGTVQVRMYNVVHSVIQSHDRQAKQLKKPLEKFLITGSNDTHWWLLRVFLKVRNIQGIDVENRISLFKEEMIPSPFPENTVWLKLTRDDTLVEVR